MIARVGMALGALLMLASLSAPYFYGVRVGIAQEQAAQKRADDAASAEAEKIQRQIDADAQSHQGDEYERQAHVREITRESQTIIERPVYRNVCIDDDGVQLLDRASAIANGESRALAAGTATGTAESLPR